MAAAGESYPYNSRRQDDSDFNLREWEYKARISHQNTKSRRYSASYTRSFREEDTKPFRPNIPISSTASSPGYPLKALQARSGYKIWECLSPDGFALNSKWNEAEKYICNPLSGEVPMECLSAKTLSGRSFRNSRNRIIMSSPLVYSSRQIHTKPSAYTQEEVALQFHTPEKKKEGMASEAGIHSTPSFLNSNSSITALTPSIKEKSIEQSEESPNSKAKTKSEEEVELKVKEIWEKKETEYKNEWRKKNDEQLWRGGGCFSWIRNRRQRKRERNNIIPTTH